MGAVLVADLPVMQICHPVIRLLQAHGTEGTEFSMAMNSDQIGVLVPVTSAESLNAFLHLWWSMEGSGAEPERPFSDLDPRFLRCDLSPEGWQGMVVYCDRCWGNQCPPGHVSLPVFGHSVRVKKGGKWASHVYWDIRSIPYREQWPIIGRSMEEMLMRPRASALLNRIHQAMEGPAWTQYLVLDALHHTVKVSMVVRHPGRVMEILSQWQSTESLIAQFKRNPHSVPGYLSVTVAQDGNHSFRLYTRAYRPADIGNTINAYYGK